MVSWSAFELACKANPCARRIPPVRAVSSAEVLDLIPYPSSFLAGRSEEVTPTPIVVATVPVQGAQGLSKRTVVPVTVIPVTVVNPAVPPVIVVNCAVVPVTVCPLIVPVTLIPELKYPEPRVNVFPEKVKLPEKV